MLVNKSITGFLQELASNSPAPGGGSVAAFSGALGSALTSMVCNLTIGKKKYAAVDEEVKKTLAASENLRARFTALIDRDTEAFNRVMDAYGLPKENDAQKALRTAAVREATREATLVPLEVMKHCIDAMALAQDIAANGNINSVSDAGVSALMLNAACQGAALNVKINLQSLDDHEFVAWKSDEVESLLKTSTMMLEEVTEIVAERLKKEES